MDLRISVANAAKFNNISVSIPQMRAGIEERGVSKVVRKKEWAKPQLKKLGEIKDIAGAQTPLAQGNNQKT